MFSSSAFVLLFLASSACADIYVTSPVASSSFAAGQSAVISWSDDGTVPSLASFGPATIGLYAGNADQQTELTVISSSTNVSAVNNVTFIPEASAGPNSGEYFIRFDSISLANAAAPQYPAQAFSAKFTLTGMTGAFSPAVQSEIDGQTTAPLAGATAAATGATGATGSALAATSTQGTSTAVQKTTSARTSASATSSNSASSTFNVGSIKMWAGAMAGVAIGML